MIDYKNIYSQGYSLTTVDKNKIANFYWKKYQEKQMNLIEFEKQLNYKGGKIKNNGSEINPTEYIALICGYNGIEVLDIDLKVYNNQKDRDIFWNEFFNLLNDNINDFSKKFIIAKTKNNGFHIIYKCSEPAGNKKIAVLEGMKEAIIETRGVGGYIVLYPGNDYSNIKKVSDEDREILMTCAKMYNHTPESEIKEPEYEGVNTTPWEDFNQKNRIWDLISNEFEFVRETQKATIIKRNGAKSPHSGYIFKNSDRLYLFSPKTIYPAKKLLSPFMIYTYQRHNGNFKEAARQLYFENYGSRSNTRKISKIVEKDKNPFKPIPFPVQIFSSTIFTFINEVSEKAMFSKDFMAVSIISAISTILGQKVRLKVNNTWFTSPIFWFSVVGTPGSKKSHPVKFCLKPLKEFDIENKAIYDEQMRNWDDYNDMDDFERKEFLKKNGKVRKPKYYQYVVKDATIEALFNVHEINNNGILLYKDELIGLIKGMGQYKNGAGEEMEQFLSMFDGDEIKKNRVSKEPLLIPDTCVNIIGTIQPGVLDKIPRDNGLMQRFLFTNADTKIKRFSSCEIDKNIINSYFTMMKAVRDTIKKTEEKIIYILSPNARDEFIKIDNYLCDIQDSKDTDSFTSQYAEKLKTYLPRFCLFIEIINSIEKDVTYSIISDESVKKAFLLIKYFLNSARFLFHEQGENAEAKEITKSITGKSIEEKILILAEKGISKRKIAEQVGKSHTYIYSVLAQIRNKK